MTSSARALAIRALHAHNGPAAYRTPSALSTVNRRSGMRALMSEAGSLLERRKERANLAPNFRATGESAPVRADQPDELIALIDGDEVILRGGRSPGMANAVNEQGRHIGFHLAQNWIGVNDVGPCVEGR